MAMGVASGAAGTGDIWQVTLALAVVVLAILALAWLLKRLQRGAISGSAHLKVVASLPVGPRERVLLVDVAGTQVLLGVTAQQITALHHFGGQVVPPETPGTADFATRLRQAIGSGSTR